MRHKLLLFFTLSFIFYVISCSKDNDDDNQGSIVIEDPDEDVFIEADPDLNSGMITFEETGPSFKTENYQPSLFEPLSEGFKNSTVTEFGAFPAWIECHKFY